MAIMVIAIASFGILVPCRIGGEKGAMRWRKTEINEGQRFRFKPPESKALACGDAARVMLPRESGRIRPHWEFWRLVMFRRKVLFPWGLFVCVAALMAGLNGCGGTAPAVPPVVPTPGYTLAASGLSPASVTAGSASTSAITVTSANGYTGSVSLACSKITGGTPAPTCSFSVSPITVTETAPGTSTLTVTTSSSTPGGSYAITVTGSDAKSLAPSNGPQALALTTTAVLQHVVIIFQENRTPDNLFQDPVLIARGADIAPSGKNVNSPTGVTTLTPTTLVTNYDLSHAHAAFLTTYDNGNMDGANQIPTLCPAPCTPPLPSNVEYQYVQASDVQPYFTLAETYTFGDRMFQTNQGPSFPAHQYILSGTSMASTQLTAPSNFSIAENPNDLTVAAGCIAPATNLVELIDTTNMDAATNETTMAYPCFDHPTLTDLLDQNKISWKYYTPSAGSIWTAPDAISHMCVPNAAPPNGTACTGSDWTNNVVLNQTQILTDITSGQLSAMSWVIPDGKESDHALSNDGSGPSWVASIVNAIGGSPYWANTAIIIAWDDWGGWYDHVAPPVSATNSYQMGFRVPLIVVSPYAKAAYISHQQHDFGSILKFIETVFHLPTIDPTSPYPYADLSADDLSDCFDFSQTPLMFQTVPALLPAQHFLDDKRPHTDPDDD
jgi:phospholipase C